MGRTPCSEGRRRRVLHVSADPRDSRGHNVVIETADLEGVVATVLTRSALPDNSFTFHDTTTRKLAMEGGEPRSVIALSYNSADYGVAPIGRLRERLRVQASGRATRRACARVTHNRWSTLTGPSTWAPKMDATFGGVELSGGEHAPPWMGP